MISFKPLEHMLIDRGMNKVKLGQICGFSPSTLERVCRVLDCRIQDVVEFLPDEAGKMGCKK